MPKKLAVVGLGYVGLPVALLASQKKWQVIGVDIDEGKVAKINQQQSPLEDATIAKQLKKYPIKATSNPAAVAEADLVIVAVPTPVTGDHLPDLHPLKAAIESIGPHLRPGQVVSIESTINPGIMDEIVAPILEECGVVIDNAPDKREPVYLVHCPERINPGDSKWTVNNIARVIGGYSQDGVTKAQELYAQIIDAPLRAMDTVTEAEAVKIFENTFRDINIAYVNEMAKSFDKLGINITNVINGAATKPFAFLAHYPGNGVGGHCISVDPYYMIERAKEAGFTHRFLKLAREINDSMPGYTIELMEHGLSRLGIKPQDAHIALLGLAYKKDIDDVRESPALAIEAQLKQRNYTVSVFDPYLPQRSTVDSLEAALAGANVIMLSTNHTAFQKELTPAYLKQKNIQLVVDGKNMFDPHQIEQAGIAYYGVGRSNLSN